MKRVYVPKKPNRVAFETEDFNTVIEHQGVYVRVTPVVVCPNKSDKYGTNHDLDCPLCFGKQYIDVCERSREEWVFIQGIHLDKQLNVQGIWDAKDAKISTKSSIRLYYQYKIELLDFESTFNEIVERRSGDADNLRYEAVAECGESFIVIDKNRKFYELNVDFRVSGKNINWLGLNRPSGLYTVSYPMRPTFRVIELLNENRNYYNQIGGEKIPVNLPQHAILRLDYLLENGGLEKR